MSEANLINIVQTYDTSEYDVGINHGMEFRLVGFHS